MQVTESIHALKIPFKLRIGPDKTVDRFVFAYLILGDQICLIDSGVAGSEAIIFDYIKQAGRDPREIANLVFTHSHPDHIGGGQAVKNQTGCKVAAHIDARPWIENVDHQYEERPIGNFHELVGGSVEVDRGLKDGDCLDLGDGQTLEVFHTPGHSKGSISLLYNKDMALFTGDAVPKPDTVPIYEDVAISIASINKLRGIKGLQVLIASWDDPQVGADVYPSMDQGLQWFQQIHAAVLAETSGSDALDPKELSARVLKRLGFPEIPLVPIIVTSIGAHLKLLDHQDLMAV
ncbi:MAG: MBL fold metallo-hydrolase [Desulfobacterales bacterium]|jgi:glyoxylase-like metal-dependent hydrolase (beta-lactamase superfamily II)